MFEHLNTLAPDPILGLIKAFKNDPRPQKIDLGVGVYKNEYGETPVLECVKAAEHYLWGNEASKSYVGSQGSLAFLSSIAELAFGMGYSEDERHFSSIQTPGGCGALRLLAELIALSSHSARVWVSDPTWVNHIPLFSACKISLQTYRYYAFEKHSLDMTGMLEDLQNMRSGDVLLLHACCHNPSGADLNRDQWREIINLCSQKGVVPLFDMAYQGFASSLDEDAYAVRLASKLLPEMMLSISCSKNFGLYRERVGAAFIQSPVAKQARAVSSQLTKITREDYSMPPSHGARVVSTILSSPAMRSQWSRELDEKRFRIADVRQLVTAQLGSRLNDKTGSGFDFIMREKGMFSFLGLNTNQVSTLAKDYGIYMAHSSRVNISGLNSDNVCYFADALVSVLS